MTSFTFALTLASALTPAPVSSSHADVAPRALTMTVAQAGPGPAPVGTAPAPTAPPPATAYAPAPAFAPPPLREAAPVNRGISAWVLLPYQYGGLGLGIGGRYALPLTIPSLIRGGRLRDNWALEFGFDYTRYSLGYLGNSDYTVNWFAPVCGFMWQLWINDNFAVYPKVEAGYHFAWVSGYPEGYSSPTYGGIVAGGAAGLIYRMGESLALRAEVGNYGVKGGVSFMF